MDIADDVLDFIARRIDSVPHLEALLLLWENSPSTWDEIEVSKRIYVSPEFARTVLQDLARHGLITALPSSSGYRYEPGWDETQMVSRVAATYRRHLVHVASLIHTKASSGAVEEFARAFRFKRKE